jgi:hypothetical protein
VAATAGRENLSKGNCSAPAVAFAHPFRSVLGAKRQSPGFADAVRQDAAWWLGLGLALQVVRVQTAANPSVATTTRRAGIRHSFRMFMSRNIFPRTVHTVVVYIGGRQTKTMPQKACTAKFWQPA